MEDWEWAAKVARTHREGEIFLWRDKAALLTGTKGLMTLFIVKDADLTAGKKSFSEMGWTVRDASNLLVVSHRDFKQTYEEIVHQAREEDRSVVDFGQEMVLRMFAEAPGSFSIIFNTFRRRPGNPNVQSLLGGSVPNFTELFPQDTWLSDVTGMRRYPVSADWQLPFLVNVAQEASRGKKLILPRAI